MRPRPGPCIAGESWFKVRQFQKLRSADAYVNAAHKSRITKELGKRGVGANAYSDEICHLFQSKPTTLSNPMSATRSNQNPPTEVM